jgi:CheY-like chemotaxis protein
MAKALVVEDDDGIIPAIEEALVARGDASDRAKSLEEARRLFRGHDYAYVLLDLKIPARDGGAFPDMTYGVTLLKEIRQTKGKETTPVIAMTSHHSDGFGIATELHAHGVNSCISKPFDEKRPLMREIDEVLTRHAEGNAPKRPPKKLTPFNAAKRVMVIEDDRVTVCGIEVWKDCAQPHLRQALTAPSRQEDGRFVRIRPTKIDRDLGRNASNPMP